MNQRVEDETMDSVFGGEIKLWQHRTGYRFSLDSVLLAHFASIRTGDKVIDLGTGNGVIAMMLAYLYPSISIRAVEVQQGMARRAERNARLNGLDDRVTIVWLDLMDVPSSFAPGSFDLVISNPPFRRLRSGRVSPKSEKQIARHEMKATLDDFLASAVFLLAAKGRFACIYLAERSVDLLATMRRVGIEPKRLQAVHPLIASDAHMVLVEGVKAGGAALQVLPPLVIYDQPNHYSSDVADMLLGRKRSGPSV
jgi:tRNA1Val (adenine37-N6)-methyltransferase